MKTWMVLASVAGLLGWRIWARGSERYFLAPGESEPASYYDDEPSML
jgi:hypothetical protein